MDTFRAFAGGFQIFPPSQFTNLLEPEEIVSNNQPNYRPQYTWRPGSTDCPPPPPLPPLPNPTMSHVWKYGEMCEAWYEKDGMWYPAVIISIDASAVFVEYIGYFERKLVHMTSIRLPSSQTRELIMSHMKSRFPKHLANPCDNQKKYDSMDENKCNSDENRRNSKSHLNFKSMYSSVSSTLKPVTNVATEKCVSRELVETEEGIWVGVKTRVDPADGNSCFIDFYGKKKGIANWNNAVGKPNKSKTDTKTQGNFSISKHFNIMQMSSENQQNKGQMTSERSINGEVLCDTQQNRNLLVTKSMNDQIDDVAEGIVSYSSDANDVDIMKQKKKSNTNTNQKQNKIKSNTNVEKNKIKPNANVEHQPMFDSVFGPNSPAGRRHIMDEDMILYSPNTINIEKKQLKEKSRISKVHTLVNISPPTPPIALSEPISDPVVNQNNSTNPVVHKNNSTDTLLLSNENVLNTTTQKKTQKKAIPNVKTNKTNKSSKKKKNDRKLTKKELDHKLHEAARKGRPQTVKYFIDAGADVNSRDSRKGYTALHQAAWYGHRAVVQVLLNQGARPQVVNFRGETAVDAASLAGRPDMVELMKDALGPTDFFAPVEASDNDSSSTI